MRVLGHLRLHRGGPGRGLRPGAGGLDREQIRAWYNGYNWTGEAVYNPFDVLLLFRSASSAPGGSRPRRRPSWSTCCRARGLAAAARPAGASEALLSAFDVDHIATEALLFQTGYLTIDRAAASARWLPVPAALSEPGGLPEPQRRLLEPWTPPAADRCAPRSAAVRSAARQRLRPACSAVHGLLRRIPHEWYRNNPIARYEGYYASVFYAYFASLGLDLTPEDSSNAGRLDMALRFNGQVYLFEFKVVELAPRRAAPCSRSRTAAMPTSTAPRASRST
jgi:hypothetical protein